MGLSSSSVVLKAFEVSLQDEDGGETVAPVFSAFPGKIGLNQDPLCLGTCKPFVEGVNRDIDLLFQGIDEGEHFLGYLAQRAIHIARQVKDDSSHSLLDHQVGKEGEILVGITPLIDGKRARQDFVLVG